MMPKKYCAVRTKEEMKEVLMNPDAEGPEIFYYMIRGGKDKTNITIWEDGTVGNEYIKTYGHYHISDIDETYWIAGGRGIILLQQRKIDKNGDPIDNEIELFLAIKVRAGDIIDIPPKFGHLAVNIGNTWLVTIDNSPVNLNDSVEFPIHADYEPIRKMHGFAYYVVNDGEPKLVKNERYIIIPEPKWINASEWKDG